MQGDHPNPIQHKCKVQVGRLPELRDIFQDFRTSLLYFHIIFIGHSEKFLNIQITFKVEAARHFFVQIPWNVGGYLKITA